MKWKQYCCNPDSRGVRTDYRFYEDGKLAEVLVDQQRLASYRYDDQGRVAEVVYEGGAADLYAYDAAGRVSQYRRVLTGNQKERVESVSLHYDPQGNLDSVSGSSLGQIHFVKQQGMLTAMRGKAAATYRYSLDGRLVAVEGPEGSKSEYHYGADGALSKVETSWGNHRSSLEVIDERVLLHQGFMGEQTRYTFTPAGTITSVEDPYGQRTSYVYAEDRLQRIELPNGMCQEYHYEQETGRLTEERIHACSKNEPEAQ